MNLSGTVIDRLNELELPNTKKVYQILNILLQNKNNILAVKDLPNGMKEVIIIEPPLTKDDTNGTNTTSPPTR